MVWISSDSGLNLLQMKEKKKKEALDYFFSQKANRDAVEKDYQDMREEMTEQEKNIFDRFLEGMNKKGEERRKKHNDQ